MIAVLIWCLVRMKRKNDLIVAKVETLAASTGKESEGNKPEIDKNDDFNASKNKSDTMPEKNPVSSPRRPETTPI